MIGNDSGATLFISDLHLCNTRPETTGQFLKFLQTIAVNAQSLYILGDLFEYWAGDDDLNDPYHQTIVSALRALSAKGTQIFLIHGNRDLLLGQSFADTAALKLLEDPTLRCMHGKQVLLSHGDSLCTDDTAYQAFRQQVHDRVWQTNFLNQSLHERKQQIEALRTRSEQEKSGKNESIMDVNSKRLRRCCVLLTIRNYSSMVIRIDQPRIDWTSTGIFASASCWVPGIIKAVICDLMPMVVKKWF